MDAKQQTRFEELKAKGWKNLVEEERKEYTELKALEQPKDETVTMSKADLQSLLDEAVAKAKASMPSTEGMEEALRLGKWVKNQQPRKENPMATLRLYRKNGLAEPGLVIDWKFIRNDEDPDTRKKTVPIYLVTVLYGNKKETVELPLLELVQINEFEKVEIIKSSVEEQKRLVGVGQKPHTAGGYQFSSPAFFGTKHVGAGESFDFWETRKDGLVTVKRLDGTTLELPVNRLNQ